MDNESARKGLLCERCKFEQGKQEAFKTILLRLFRDRETLGVVDPGHAGFSVSRERLQISAVLLVFSKIQSAMSVPSEGRCRGSALLLFRNRRSQLNLVLLGEQREY